MSRKKCKYKKNLSLPWFSNCFYLGTAMAIHMDIYIVAGIFVGLTKGVFLMKILIETSDFTV